MSRKKKFGELDGRMRAEYDRRIQEIEDGLSDDGSFDPDRIDSEMLYRRIQDKIQERQEEKQEKKKRLYRIEKIAALLVMTVVGIFLVSMTSEADRRYLGDRIRYLIGNEMVMRERGGDEQKGAESDEKEQMAYREIEDQIGISVPILKYGSGEENSFEYEFSHEDAAAMLKYQFDDMILTLLMVNKKRTETSGIVIHGKRIKEVDVLEGLLTIPVQEVKDTTDFQPTYAAQWEYKDGYYQLSGKVKEKKFIEVVENIYY